MSTPPVHTCRRSRCCAWNLPWQRCLVQDNGNCCFVSNMSAYPIMQMQGHLGSRAGQRGGVPPGPQVYSMHRPPYPVPSGNMVPPGASVRQPRNDPVSTRFHMLRAVLLRRCIVGWVVVAVMVLVLVHEVVLACENMGDWVLSMGRHMCMLTLGRSHKGGPTMEERPTR